MLSDAEILTLEILTLEILTLEILRTMNSSNSYSRAVNSISRFPRLTSRVAVLTTRSAGPYHLVPVRPPHYGFDPGQELFDVEGLGEVVVRAPVQAMDLVQRGIAGCEHYHGYLVAALPQPLQDPDPVHPGQHYVQHDRVWSELPRGLQAGVAAANLEAPVLQLELQEPGYRKIVLYDEYPGPLSLLILAVRSSPISSERLHILEAEPKNSVRGGGSWTPQLNIIRAMSPVLDKARLSAAILAARAARLASRTLRRGGGSTVPGVVARRVDPKVLTKLSKGLRRGSAAITGTNGKTTTTRMVGKILQTAGLRAINNSTGANLVTGVTAALVSDSSLSGKPRSEVGLFEVDEASVPKVAAEADLSLLAVLNLFRDQLDRYGELAYTGKVIASAFPDLPHNGRVVLNADDPLVASLGRSAGNPIYFGVDEPALDTGKLQHIADSKDCPVCGTALRYDAVYFGHIGIYRCPNCSFARPEPAYRASRIRMDGPRGTDFLLSTPSGGVGVRVNLPGLYNVYNAVAAAAVAGEMGAGAAHIAQGIREFGGAFGRVERVRAGDRDVFLLLIKNPVGFNEILRTFVAGQSTTAGNVLIAINDNDADGRDVSWLWDVDFEMLAEDGENNVRFDVTGIRAHDMAVRLKYAELPVHSVLPDRKEALMSALAATAPGETLYVLPTYTAMLQLRRTLSDLGYTHPFWEE